MKYALKSKVSLAVCSLVMGMNVAHAAQSTQVTVTARVAATTCDVLPIGVSGGRFDLGSVLASDFKAADSKTGKNQIGIKLSNCAPGGTPSSGKLGVYVNGAVLSGADDAFNDDDGGNLAIKVSDSAYTRDYKNGDFIADSSTDSTSTGALVPIFLSVTAPKFTGGTVSPEDVVATLRFTADYK